MPQFPEDPQTVRPLLANATIPQFVLTNTDGRPFDVNAAVRERPTILLFYRGGW
jgi:peroxiredoxin